MAKENGPDMLFTVNEEIYRNWLEPGYSHFITPKTLVQIPIILPFRVPFQEGYVLSLQVEEEFCTYLFSTVLTLEEVAGIDIIMREHKLIEAYKSRVEMIYVTDKEVDSDNIKESLSDLFDLLLRKLNLVITSYQLFSRDTEAYLISRQMLNIHVPYRVVQLPAWETASPGLFMIHTNLPTSLRKPLSNEEHDKITWYTNILNQQWNPFILSEEITLTGERHYKRGIHREAVLYFQMGIETMLNALFVHLLMEEGKSFADAETTMANIPFLSMMKKEFHSRIGGSWNVEDTRTRVGKWYRDAFMLRNRVTHAGYYPSFEEVDNARTAALDLRHYVVSLLKAKKKTYPGVWKYFET